MDKKLKSVKSDLYNPSVVKLFDPDPDPDTEADRDRLSGLCGIFPVFFRKSNLQ